MLFYSTILFYGLYFFAIFSATVMATTGRIAAAVVTDRFIAFARWRQCDPV